jgi:hypothetical protein
VRRIAFLHDAIAAAFTMRLSAPVPGSCAPTALACLPDASLCEGVGRDYLRRHPNEAHPDVLRRLLARSVSAANGDDAVVADRWILTRSEARRCALTVLER